MLKKSEKQFMDKTIARCTLAKKMWELNDSIFEKWGEVKILLDITSAEDKKQMKKGLVSISKTLRNISEELEKACLDDVEIVEEGENGF